MKKINCCLLCFVLSLFFVSCTPPQMLYLTPGKYLDPVAEQGGSVSVVLQEFLEDFGEAELVGEHVIGSKKQNLKIKTAQVSSTLDSLLRDRFIDRGVTFKHGNSWNLQMDGLERLADSGNGLVVGGKITRLSVKAETGFTRLTTKLELAMDVDCFIGVVKQRKIIRKSVYITEKVIKVSANQKAIEKVLDGFLATAAQQVMLNIEEPLAQIVHP
jgi:hypothetical protein